MAKAARTFEELSGGSLLQSVSAGKSSSEPLPWGLIAAGALPPMMFELRAQDGSLTSYPYNDLRMVRCPHAGCVELYLLSLGKLVITIEGRHLCELASAIGAGLVRWMQEGDPRDLKSEDAPEITQISVHSLAD